MADVKMPQLGESVTEGTIGKWLKRVGDFVTKYEPLAEVITDKVNAEIPSDFEGVMAEVLIAEGETVRVGTVICRIEEADGEAADTAVVHTASGAAVDVTPQQGVDSAGDSTRSTNREAQIAGVTQESAGRGRFSPAVLKLAEEHGVNLSEIRGTGEGGRITRKDVLAYLSNAEQTISTAVPAGNTGTNTRPETLAEEKPDVDTAPSARPEEGTVLRTPQVQQQPTTAATGDVEVIEPSAVRKIIAKRMVDSKHTAPHAWTTVEADVSALVAFRDGTKLDFKRKEGVDLTYLPFFIKAVVEALKQYPMLNAAWIDDKIHVKKEINISIAVATNDELAVPVIHNADRLSIAGLAHEINALAARARSGKLTVKDVQGGTFTVNNTGAFGSILSQPIINMPQAAILSVESIVKRPVVVNDAIAIRSMVNLCLSLDHRLLDGWTAGQFLKAVKERVQTFGPDTVLY